MTLANLRKRLRKVHKWKGALIHLRRNERLSGVSPQMAEAIYEHLMQQFDPELFELRQAKKKKAARDTEREHLESANAAASCISTTGCTACP